MNQLALRTTYSIFHVHSCALVGLWSLPPYMNEHHKQRSYWCTKILLTVIVFPILIPLLNLLILLISYPQPLPSPRWQPRCFWEPFEDTRAPKTNSQFAPENQWLLDEISERLLPGSSTASQKERIVSQPSFFRGYCWWQKSGDHHLGWCWNPIKLWDIHYQPQLVRFRRISEPSTVCSTSRVDPPITLQKNPRGTSGLFGPSFLVASIAEMAIQHLKRYVFWTKQKGFEESLP